MSNCSLGAGVDRPRFFSSAAKVGLAAKFQCPDASPFFAHPVHSNVPASRTMRKLMLVPAEEFRSVGLRPCSDAKAVSVDHELFHQLPLREPSLEYRKVNWTESALRRSIIHCPVKLSCARAEMANISDAINNVIAIRASIARVSIATL